MSAKREWHHPPSFPVVPEGDEEKGFEKIGVIAS